MNNKILDAIQTLNDIPLEFCDKKYVFKAYGYKNDNIIATCEGKDYKINISDIKEYDTTKPNINFKTEEVSVTTPNQNEITVTKKDVNIPTDKIADDIKDLFIGQTPQTGGYGGSTLNSISDLKGVFVKNQNGGNLNENNNTTLGNLSEFQGKKNNNNNVNFLHNYLMKGGGQKFEKKMKNFNDNFNSDTSDYCE
jgi:hypothetical protein